MQETHLLIQDIELLSRGVLLEELGSDLALGGEDDAVLGQNANGRAGVRDGLEGIFDLVQTPVGGEDGCLGARLAGVGIERKLRGCD